MPEAFCPSCRRNVHLGSEDEPFCPVCSSRLTGLETSEEVAVRIGRNEAIFREVNDRIKDIADDGDLGMGEPLGLICECGDMKCSEPLAVPLKEYFEVRSHPARFLIVPGHEIAGVEVTIAEHDAYSVVEKVGAARAKAIEASTDGDGS